MKQLFTFLLCLAVASCNNNKTGESQKQETSQTNYQKTGSIERIDPALDSIIDKLATPEIIADGFLWSEGPLWLEPQQMLICSDVRKNSIYQWTEKNGKQLYLRPSGTNDTSSYVVGPNGLPPEVGSNGLLLDKNGNLILCQHGNRQVAKMDAALDKPEAKFISIASHYQGKRFNSPNDAVYNSAGELFFTDPPYGLEKGMDDPKKEIPFQGVYKVETDGKVSLIVDSITRPNGIAFLPGEKTMLVANSDPAKPYWYAIEKASNDSLSVRIFYSAAGSDSTLKGSPDGMKVDSRGTVFATGPGGVWIFSSAGKLLGKVRLENATSNIALSADEKTMYITNHMYLVRVKMR